MPIWRVKNAKIQRKKGFTPNAPKRHLEIAHDQNVQNLHIWLSKMPIWGVKNVEIFKICFAPNASKSHLGVSHDQNLPNLNIWGKKTVKICTPNFFLQMPPKVIRVSHKILILGVKNAKICKNLYLFQMPPIVI